MAPKGHFVWFWEWLIIDSDDLIISIRMSSNSIILFKTQDRVSAIKWACFESVLNSINLWISGFSWILSLFYMINYRFWASWRTGQQKRDTFFDNFVPKCGYRQTDKQTSKQTDRHRTWIFWALYTKSPFGAIKISTRLHLQGRVAPKGLLCYNSFHQLISS